MQAKDIRLSLLYQWTQKQIPVTNILPITGDASFRRYVRVQSPLGHYIAVDSPPSRENNAAFIAVARLFLKIGLHVPEIVSFDLDHGFFLLSDLGDTQLLRVLNENNVDQHYSTAMLDIIKLQPCYDFENWQLPSFDQPLLMQELIRFQEWYLIKLLGLELSANEIALLHEAYALLINSAVKQPQVCVHRDFHSRNLMLIADNRLGILDFQDAVRGPITYDLVSLLRDCYIKWPIGRTHRWVKTFYEMLKFQSIVDGLTSAEEFLQWFDWMGLQRHLKVLGIFARLYQRDGKDSYLNDIPRILEYVTLVLDSYSRLAPLKDFIKTRILHESNDFSCRSGQPNETPF